jgi:Ca2+-binding RTX toxin-like protein
MAGVQGEKIFGDNGNDTLIGGANDDTLWGLGGNDVIIGAKGGDTMIGGSGNDILIWNNGDGSDRMKGENGYDIIGVNGSVEKGDEFTLKQDGDLAIFDRVNLVPFKLTVDTSEAFVVNGLGGNDKFSVFDLSNTDVKVVKFSGGLGNDTLDGSETSTRLYARGDYGNDELIGGSADDTLYGNYGNDDIEGEKGNDTMIGGWGNDTLGWDDGDGSDRMSGGKGYDTIEVDGSVEKGDNFTLKQDGDLAIFDRVNLGKFTLTVDTSEKFDVEGLGGDDKFRVYDLSNTDVKLVKFAGGEGNDYLNGSKTSTRLYALGEAGNDTLIGGSGNDILIGGAGRDLLIGGAGNDILIGGDKSDTFYFNLKGAGDEVNYIKNFTSGTDHIMFNLNSLSRDDFAVVANNAQASLSDSLITYNKGTGAIYYNQNGSDAGYGDGGLFAVLQGQGANNLTYGDLMTT